jgi:phosphoribosyl-AMP cyclohydrolase
VRGPLDGAHHVVVPAAPVERMGVPDHHERRGGTLVRRCPHHIGLEGHAVERPERNGFERHDEDGTVLGVTPGANESPSAAPNGRVIAPTADQLGAVTFNADGLVPAIAQCAETGEVLMMAWMNAESLAMTFAEGRMVYWSRSRSELWRKGDTSGDRQFVQSARYDCDGDTLLFTVIQEGRGACHTGERSCFYREFGAR